MSKRVKRGTFTRRCATCGYTATYTTERLADHHFGKHSCERRLAKGLRHAKHVRQLAQIDRTPKPCLHKVADHQHGTRAAYVLDRCRCTPCSRANAEVEGERQRLKAYGRYDKFADAEPIREHLRQLGDYGIGLKRVSKISGVSNGSLTKIVFGVYEKAEGPQRGRYGKGELVRGPAKRVLRTTAEKILSVEATPANLGPGQVDPDRTPAARTHLRALVALGWSQSKLGDRLGIIRSNMTPVVSGDRFLTRGTVDRIESLYAELCMTLPPETDQRERIAASRARNYARARGWLPPLALDEDPELVPITTEVLDEQAIYRRMHGDKSVTLTRAERTDLVRRSHAQGLTDSETRARTGISADLVRRARQDLGLPANERRDLAPVSSEYGTARWHQRQRQLQDGAA